MFSAYLTSDRKNYSCPECRTKQPTTRRDLPENTADEKNNELANDAKVNTLEPPKNEIKFPFFEGVEVKAFKFGKKLQRIKLTFTGDTKPHKEDIKKLGKAWWNQALSRWEVGRTIFMCLEWLTLSWPFS